MLYRWDVFLSHSHRDESEIRQVADFFKQRKLNVWLDIEQIGPGDPILGQIVEGFERSRWLVFAMSKAAIESSSWCPREVHALLHREIQTGATRVVPLLLEPLEDDDIPPELCDKAHVRWQDNQAMGELARRLRRWRVADDHLRSFRDAPLTAGQFLGQRVTVAWRSLVEPSTVPLPPDAVERGDFDARAQSSLSLPSFLATILQQETPGIMRARILVGDAGVGKTVLCRKVCHDLATQTRSRVLPFYVPLGEWDSSTPWTSMLDRQVGTDASFDELVAAAEEDRLRFILFLDGINEQRAERIKEAWSWVRDFVAFHSAVVILTTRPMPFISSRWPGEDLAFFRVERWNDEQLREYFELNTGSDQRDALPAQIRDAIRLPLLAFLFVYAIPDKDGVARATTLSEIFDLLLRYCLDQERWGVVRPSWLRREPRKLLQVLAYAMTSQEVVQAEGGFFVQVLALEDELRAEELLNALCASGLLRCTSSRYEPRSRMAHVKIAFFHQALQDYLTALELIDRREQKLPGDLASNAFWRDVPLFIAESLHEPVSQLDFALSFITPPRADYLTAARLTAHGRDPGLRRVAADRLLERLLETLATPVGYEFAIEAFRALGDQGLKALRSCLSDSDTLARTFAEFECHLVSPEGNEAPDEAGWRQLGRATYILGELGDDWLAGHFGRHLQRIRSLHLLYHIGEALLELARRASTTGSSSDAILRSGQDLGALPSGDLVTQAQQAAIRRRLTGETAPATLLADFRSFLRERYVNTAQYFGDEFWRRAHGIEAYAELADDEDCREELTSLLRVEDTASYGSHPVTGYERVQSSILKSAARCLRRGAGTEEWKPFLEATFTSERVAGNAWACSYLENILLAWFAGPGDRGWLQGWLHSTMIGGQGIQRVLSNTLRQLTSLD